MDELPQVAAGEDPIERLTEYAWSRNDGGEEGKTRRRYTPIVIIAGSTPADSQIIRDIKMHKFKVGDRVVLDNREWIITFDFNETTVIISPSQGNNYNASVFASKSSLKKLKSECTSRNREDDIMTAIDAAIDFVEMLNELHPDAFSYAIKSINKMR